MSVKHRILWKLLRPLVAIYLRIKFGYTFEPAANLPDRFIVLSNHTTDFDPLFVGVSFKSFLRFVSSEHIARWRVFALIKFIFDPILRYKGMTAAATVMDMLRTLKCGTSVCMFAEGVRSWDGTPSPINPSTGKVIKSSKCALVTYRISGGYFTSPMWSSGSGTRKGRIHGRPMHIYTAEQLSEMSVEEINNAINDDLGEDAYDVQLKAPSAYKGRHLAEHLETLLFICPHCGEMDTVHSKDNTVFCEKCGHEFTYDEYGMLHGTAFDTVRELSLWQKGEINSHALCAVYSSPLGTLKSVDKHNETLLDTGSITMDSHRLMCGSTEFDVDSIIDLAMHGRNSLVFSTKAGYFELDVENGGNALKYQLLYNALKKLSVV